MAQVGDARPAKTGKGPRPASEGVVGMALGPIFARSGVWAQRARCWDFHRASQAGAIFEGSPACPRRLEASPEQAAGSERAAACWPGCHVPTRACWRSRTRARGVDQLLMGSVVAEACGGASYPLAQAQRVARLEEEEQRAGHQRSKCSRW